MRDCRSQVQFKLFGCIPGYVGLRGKVLPTGQAGDTVKVLFEPASISFGGLHLRIGVCVRVYVWLALWVFNRGCPGCGCALAYGGTARGMAAVMVRRHRLECVVWGGEAGEAAPPGLACLLAAAMGLSSRQ